MSVLSHYTKRAGLVGILSSGTLWATNFLDLEDTSEFFYAFDLLCRDAFHYAMSQIPNELKLPNHNLDAAFDALKSDLVNSLKSQDGYGQLYVVSLARGTTPDHEQRGIFTLWDRYTKHEGYCLQFSEQHIREKLKSELSKGSYAWAGLKRVTYGVDTSEPEFRALSFQLGETMLLQAARATGYSNIPIQFQSHWAQTYLVRRLLDYCATRKDPCFADEREVRIFAYPAEQAVARVFTGVAYRKQIRVGPTGRRYVAIGEHWRPGIAPQRIIVGARADFEITPLLAVHGLDIEVSKSNLPVSAD